MNEIKSEIRFSRRSSKYSLRAENNVDLTIFVFAFRLLNGTGVAIVVLVSFLLFYKRNVFHLPFYHVVYGNSSLLTFGNECVYHWHIQNINVERKWTAMNEPSKTKWYLLCSHFRTSHSEFQMEIVTLSEKCLCVTYHFIVYVQNIKIKMENDKLNLRDEHLKSATFVHFGLTH